MRIAILLCLCSAGAFGTTYYKVGGDPSNGSSFYGNYSPPSCGWSTTQGATTTSTFSADDFAAASCIIDDAEKYLRVPKVTSPVTFGGQSLTLTSGGKFVFCHPLSGMVVREITVGDLRVADEGMLTVWGANSAFALCGKLTLAENAVLTFYASFASETVSSDARNLEIRSTLAGPASSKIWIDGAAGKNTKQSSLLLISDAADFLGTIEAAPDESVNDFTLEITGPFGGSITSLPAGTKAVNVNYDGLPSETGLRVATTTVPEALKTKLTFDFPSMAALSSPGVKLLTFPKGTELDPAEFIFPCRTEMDLLKLALGVVTNADETVSLVTMGEPIFVNALYKVGYDPSDSQSSRGGNVSGTVGWSTNQGATATSAFSAAEFADASCFIDNADKYMRTSGGSFGGYSLTLTTGGRIVLAGTFTVRGLRIADKGTLTSWKQRETSVLCGKIVLLENAVLTYYAGYANPTPLDDWRNLEIRSTLVGPASSKIWIDGAAGGNTQQANMLQISDAADFLGTIEAAPDESLNEFTLEITGPFGGSVASLPARTKAVSVNYDGLPAKTGLRVATANPDATIRTGIVLYSASKDFAAKKLPLLTFPSRPNIRAKDFTVRHATAPDGEATAFEKLRFVSNAGGSCTLVANRPASGLMITID